MAERLEAGTVWVNSYRATSYLSPFGGYKRSGIGRESGLTAIREYLQEKSVWIDTVGEVANPFVSDEWPDRGSRPIRDAGLVRPRLKC